MPTLGDYDIRRRHLRISRFFDESCGVGTQRLLAGLARVGSYVPSARPVSAANRQKAQRDGTMMECGPPLG